MEISVCAIAKIYIVPSVVLGSYFRTSSRRLKEYIDFSAYQFHNTFLGFPESVRIRSIVILGQIQKFDVCNCRWNLASGYDVDHFCVLGG